MSITGMELQMSIPTIITPMKVSLKHLKYENNVYNYCFDCAKILQICDLVYEDAE